MTGLWDDHGAALVPCAEQWCNAPEVPIPVDTLRGEPFSYSRQDQHTAVLESPAPGHLLRYEIQLICKGAGK